MASRFRAGEEDERFPPFFEPSPPPLPHPASADGYFSLQAMRAGFMGGDGPMRRPSMSLEALEMELREERIREEIIARRIAQRRMVEEQAWREMEMAMAMRIGRLREQPLPVEPLMLPPPPEEVKFGGRREFEFGRREVESGERRRFVPRVGRRDLPKIVVGRSSASLQEVETVEEAPEDVEFGKRDVEFEERERLPVRDASEFGAGKKLASGPEKTVIKMDDKVIPPKLSAIKRKAPAAILGNSSSKFPRPAQKEWSCALCQVSATCEDGLNEHLQGKKHLSKAAQLAPKKNLAVTVLPKNSGSSSSSSVSNQGVATKKKPFAKGVRKVSIQVDGKLHEVSEKGRFLWCWMCKVKCNGQAAMISHLSGKRHLLEESRKLDAMAKGTVQKEEVTLATDKELTLQNEEVVERTDKELTLQNEEVVEATDKELTLQNEEVVEATDKETSQNERVVEEKKECTEETEQHSESKDIAGSEE